MKNPLLYVALLTATSFAPLAAVAQNNTPPGYTFGMFPGMFGNNNYAMPNGFMNNGNSPFLTMPAPQYPYANPQFPNTSPTQATPAPMPALPMAQPTPFWMQTPTSPQPWAKYITEIPEKVVPRNAPPNYTVFTPPAFTHYGPPRWAPLPGQAPRAAAPQHALNTWATPFNGSQNPASAMPATPPKWPAL